jgi:hypothetical protein
MVLDDRFYSNSRITSSGADPTHHIKLSDGKHEIGFVITDQDGVRNERTFRRFPSADPTQPYITEKQSSFGGGFGQASFEENRSKYWRSLGVDTIKDALVLGPSVHYGKGAFVKAEDNLQHSTFGWANVGVGGRKWVAVQFTPSQQWTATTYLKLWCRRQGNPPSLRVRTYTNSGGQPNTLVHSQDFAPDDVITDPDGQWIRLAIPDTYTYAADTAYWLVLTVTGSGNGEWYFGHKRSQTTGLKSTDGSTWATAGWDLMYRIYGNNSTFSTRWVDYKQQTYALIAFDDTSDAQLWMNGWRGACDDNSGDLSFLYDSTQTDWGERITGDEVVKVVSGPASAEIDDYRLANAALTIDGDLAVDNDWRIAHGGGDSYVVQNSDWFSQITVPASTLDSYTTDVAVANGSMYIARGGERGIVQHEEWNTGSAWDNTRWKVRDNFKGEYLRSMRDPVQGEVLWVGYNSKQRGEWKPWVYMINPMDYYDDAAGNQHIVNNYGNAHYHEYWESDVSGSVIMAGLSTAEIRVLVGKITAVATTATGADYQVNDILTLVETGSSATGQVKVLAIDGGGAPTSYEITDAGYDYTEGAKATTGGSGDGNATVNITDASEISGLVAHIDFKDKDGNARTVDMRHMTDMKTTMKYSMLNTYNSSTLSATDMKVVLDSQAGASETGFVTLSVPNMISGTVIDYEKHWELDLDEVSGAEALTSIGITMTTQPKSYRITLSGDFWAWRDIEPVVVGQVDGDNITGLQAFGDPEQLWVFTEAGYGSVVNSHFLPVPNREIKVARHANNGRGNEVHDVYLLLTWKGRLQRYYRQNLEDLGPDYPQGMGDIAGDIVDIVTYPGRFYVAVDGGTTGRSQILCHKGGGWHEVFTSFSGERIRGLFVQSIEAKSDKLWASVGSDLIWFPIELQSAELPANTDYTYRPTGYLDTSWVYTSSRELDKVFRSILCTMDKAKDDDLNLRIHYKVDDDSDSWTKLKRTDYSASTKEFKLASFINTARGNRIKFRLELWSHDLTESPIVRSLQARMYRVPEVKFSYTFLSKLSTISVNLRGDEEKVVGQFKTVQQAFDLIDTWAAQLIPLKVTSDIASIHEKDVTIQPVPAQLLMIVHDEKIQEQTIQMQASDA